MIMLLKKQQYVLGMLTLLLVVWFVCPACDDPCAVPEDNETDRFGFADDPPTNAATKCDYAIGGIGALMAKKSGMSGWGFTKDAAVLPGGCTVGKGVRNAGFVLAVDKTAYSHVGVAWLKDKDLCVDMVKWKSREVVGTSSCSGASTSLAIPQDTNDDVVWYNVIVWVEESINNTSIITAAVGTSAEDAEAKALATFNSLN